MSDDAKIDCFDLKILKGSGGRVVRLPAVLAEFSTPGMTDG